MKQIIIATKNKGKAEEFKVFFRPYHIEALSLLDLNENVSDVEETGSTFSENAALKSETISALFGCPVIADDSGLIVEELDGEPGIYSARYAGREKNDQKNIDKLLHKLNQIPDAQRSAKFICVLALSVPGQPTTFFYRILQGENRCKAIW
ncbi:non-canonical purine NTP pyrophosphatase [Virgibacillus halophilus]|uniref:Non-canonical purine NTP pyrophosphatase n=1 Tax=Tigheibacillus halophilus TaxID=361280 RepID=A0ABU5CC34_9BACI|nr:non-canonical purine NTP pyrophosphatase [Virgibacillus halophilus]